MSLLKLFLGEKRINIHQPVDEKACVKKAIQWVKNNHVPGAGILPNHKETRPTQEVTGYLIPSLYCFGEKAFARELVQWELSVQRPDGAFSAIDNVPYTFDTAMVIRGLLSAMDDVPGVEAGLRKACDYVEKMIAPDGNVTHESYDMWYLPDGSMLSEYGNLYVLPSMLEAGKKLGEPRYTAAAKRGMEYFRRKPDLVEFKSELGMLSHYFGYMMEALVDLGEMELAKKGLAQARAIQKKDGSIPAFPGAKWVCSTGMAQLAIAWYKLGDKEPADKAMEYLLRLQNPSGGFYGGYGKGANYFPEEEISWAVKFFLDAYALKIAKDFDHEVGQYPETVEEEDGRVREILSFFQGTRNERIIEVGCGKGRFLRRMKEQFPQTVYYGLDISEKMLGCCPPWVETKLGSMLDIRYPDAFFDGVFSVEALEHAVITENAIRELSRILKPGGKILIIDKTIAMVGAIKIKSWEQWFDPRKVANMMESYGVQVDFKIISDDSYDNYAGLGGLFVVWKGIKK